MTTTKTAPQREEHRPRELTHAEFGEEGKRRFGDDAKDWAFVCPNCGDVASARDFPAGNLDAVGQECIGRHVEGRGCKTVAYGFFKGPWAITMADGTVSHLFALAPAPSQPPHDGPREPEATPGPGNADDAPDAPVGPRCGLSVQRRTPGPRPTVWGHGEILDMENWDYRVALTADQAVLGYRDAEEDRPVTVMFADAGAWQHDAFHDLAPDLSAAAEHIAKYDLPITEAQVAHALLLIVEACAEDNAAPLPSEPYLTGDDDAESEG